VRSCLRLSLALAFALGLAAPRAEAATIALVIAIDTSGSIDNNEFELQRQAYASFFSDNAAGFAGKDVEVTVLYWAGEGVQQQVVGWTPISGSQDALDFADAILATSRPTLGSSPAAQTGVARALDAARVLFQQKAFGEASLVLDISGDGTENLDFDSSASHVLDSVVIDVPGFGPQNVDVRDPWSAVFNARSALLSAGVLINALPILPVPPQQAVELQDSSPAIGFFPAPVFLDEDDNPIDVSLQWQAALEGLGYDEVSLLELFYSRVIGSPDSRVPLLVLANGFTAEELGARIAEKLSLELGVPVPEPGALALLACAAGLLLHRRVLLPR
jgi:hypothetical protein